METTNKTIMDPARAQPASGEHPAGLSHATVPAGRASAEKCVNMSADPSTVF